MPKSKTVTRRRFVQAAGVGVLALGGCLGSDDDESEWIAIDSPTEMTLYGVVMTRAGPHAVGEGGRLLSRRDGRWEVIVEEGPSGAENAIRGAAVTDNGRHLWLAGDSGVVGVYDMDAESMTDYSAPNGMTSTWVAVAVVGLADEEWVYLANGSGEVVRATHTDGKIEWGEPTKPGSGSSVSVAATVGAFLLGYNVIWALSAVVPLGFHAVLPGGIHGFAQAHTHAVIGGVLAVTGLYQLSTLKQSRLRTCCARVEPRDTNAVAGLKKGFEHGASCILVCLGPFFLLMPFFGEMNYFWMVALTTVVTIERLPSTWGEELSIATGVVSLAAGLVVVLFQPSLPIGFVV